MVIDSIDYVTGIGNAIEIVRTLRVALRAGSFFLPDEFHQ